jgi:hypothetical protein
VLLLLAQDLHHFYPYLIISCCSYNHPFHHLSLAFGLPVKEPLQFISTSPFPNAADITFSVIWVLLLSLSRKKCINSLPLFQFSTVATVIFRDLELIFILLGRKLQHFSSFILIHCCPYIRFLGDLDRAFSSPKEKFSCIRFASCCNHSYFFSSLL